MKQPLSLMNLLTSEQNSMHQIWSEKCLGGLHQQRRITVKDSLFAMRLLRFWVAAVCLRIKQTEVSLSGGRLLGHFSDSSDIPEASLWGCRPAQEKPALYLEGWVLDFNTRSLNWIKGRQKWPQPHFCNDFWNLRSNLFEKEFREDSNLEKVKWAQLLWC